MNKRPVCSTDPDAVARGIAESPGWARYLALVIAGIVLSVAGAAALILWRIV